MSTRRGDEQILASLSTSSIATSLPTFGAPDGSTGLGSLLMVFWIATGLLHPAAFWMAGANGIEVWIVAAVFSQTLLMFVVMCNAWGARRTNYVLFTVLVVGWSLEWMGTTTSWPFGSYLYTERLQPQLGGVPLLVAPAWFMMLPPCWAIAAIISGRWNGWQFQIATAVALTAWDLYLDPLAVQWGWWRWLESGSYFGVPLTNFVGWFVAGWVMTLLVRPSRLPTAPLIAVYAIIWITYPVGLFLIHSSPGPAFAGFVGMGTLLALATWSRLRRVRRMTQDQ